MNEKNDIEDFLELLNFCRDTFTKIWDMMPENVRLNEVIKLDDGTLEASCTNINDGFKFVMIVDFENCELKVGNEL